MARSHPSLRWLATHPWIPILTLAAVGLVLYAAGTRRQAHHVRAAFTSALDLVAGQKVLVDGLEVGKVDDVSLENGIAVVTLGIDAGRVWPLHQGTVAAISPGSTASLGGRRVVLQPGPPTAPAIPEDGIIGLQDTRVPVELDQLLDTMTRPARAGFRAMNSTVAGTFSGRQASVQNLLGAAPAAFDATAATAAELSAPDAQLAGLIQNADRVMSSLRTREGDIAQLVTVAASTFDTFAAHSQSVQRDLQSLPPALAQTRITLARLDPTAQRLDALLVGLGPGVSQLPALASKLRPTLALLRSVTPAGVTALDTLRAQSPVIGRLLSSGIPLSDQLSSAFTALAPMMSCVRPYAPELAGQASNWASWAQQYSPVRGSTATQTGHMSHLARADEIGSPTTVHAYPAGLSAAAFVKLTGKTYALVRPPGYWTGKPLFDPACGITPDGLDPSKDPEAP